MRNKEINNYELISFQLFGRSECYRYKKMRKLVVDTATQLGLAIQLEEISDNDILAQSSPLDLPRLVTNGVVIASRNPPKEEDLLKYLGKIE